MKFIILLLLLNITTFSRTFIGTVIDSLSNTPLKNLEIEILETGQTTITSDNGQFIIDSLPNDTINFSFKISTDAWITQPYYLKWKKKRKRDTIRYSFDLVLDTLYYAPVETESKVDSQAIEEELSEIITVEKNKADFWLPTMTVKGRKLKKSGLGKQTIDRKAIKKMPGLAEPDVMRTVQMLPGVVASSDFSNKLYVRGGSSDQNLILLDNAVVYSPSHFFGFFSTFNVDALDDVEFYKGGFPVKFGNRLSSVLDIKQRDGKDGFIHGGLGISLLSGKAYLEGGIKDKAHWLWTYRQTWIDKALSLAESMGSETLNLPYYYFYDSQGKISLNLTEKDTISFSGYFGDDSLNFRDLFIARWGNRVASLNFTHGFNNRLHLNTNLSFSQFNQIVSMGGDLFIMTNDISEINGRVELVKNVSPNILLTIGTEINNFDVLFEQDLNMPALDTTFSEKTNSNLLSGYLDTDIKLLNDIKIKPGVRLSYYEPTGSIQLDPRLDAEIKLLPRTELLGHIGKYSQFLTSITFGDQELPTEFWYAIQDDMKPSTSYLFSLGTNSQIGRSSSLSIEGYYKLFENLPVFSIENDNPDVNSETNALMNFSDFFYATEGYSFGFETMFKRQSGMVNGYASYALGYSIMLDTINGESIGDSLIYSSRWDKRHSVNIVGNLEWMGEFGLHQSFNTELTSSISFSYGSGLPYSRVLGVKHSHANRNDSYININGDKNGERYPIYSRLDVTMFRFSKKFKKFDFTLYWQIINFFDHENVWFYQFDYNEDEGGEVPATKDVIGQLPAIRYFVGMEVEF